MNINKITNMVGVSFVILLGGCGCHEKIPDVPLNDFEQRQPFLTKVDGIYKGESVDTNLVSEDFVAIKFVDNTGKEVCISTSDYQSRAENQLLFDFAKTLHRGMTYEFPTVWLDFKATNKVNSTRQP
jgi:hypothetical protein